jgi:hypothetical protein
MPIEILTKIYVQTRWIESPYLNDGMTNQGEEIYPDQAIRIRERERRHLGRTAAQAAGMAKRFLAVADS